MVHDGYDPRRNPDPATIRGRTWYCVEGVDVTDGLPMRAMFSAPTLTAAIELAQREGMTGDLYLVESADIRMWQRWCDGLVPHSGAPLIPRPHTGKFLGTLELVRPAVRRR
jgi:hypothetical protein